MPMAQSSHLCLRMETMSHMVSQVILILVLSRAAMVLLLYPNLLERHRSWPQTYHKGWGGDSLRAFYMMMEMFQD